VADLTLTAAPLLGGFHKDYGSVTLSEVTGLAIVSISTPLGGDAALAKAVKRGLDADMPNATRIKHGADGMILVSSAADQMMVLFEHAAPDANTVIQKKLKGTAYTTDQTDNWVVMDIEGPDALRALERICPIDLHTDAFVEGQSARTVMEHLGTVILRTGPNRYRLMSASSSAQSFLHAVETSIQNIS